MDTSPTANTRFRTRVALAITFGVTLAAVLGVLIGLAFNGPPSAAAGAVSLGVGICVVAGSVAVAARADGPGE